MAEFDANVGKLFGTSYDYQKFYNMMGWYGLDKTKAFEANKQNTTWTDDYNNCIKAPGMYIDSRDCK